MKEQGIYAVWKDKYLAVQVIISTIRMAISASSKRTNDGYYGRHSELRCLLLKSENMISSENWRMSDAFYKHPASTAKKNSGIKNGNVSFSKIFYLETCYNTKSIDSFLGYLTPCQFEISQNA